MLNSRVYKLNHLNGYSYLTSLTQTVAGRRFEVACLSLAQTLEGGLGWRLGFSGGSRQTKRGSRT